MNILIVFLCGIIFINIIYPILDSVTGLFMTWLESLKMKCSVKMAEYQKQINDIAEEIDTSSGCTHAIGFCAPTEEEEEFEEDSE